MSTERHIEWYSDKKDWDYQWKIGRGPAFLSRHNDVLGFTFGRQSSPDYLLAVMNLVQNPDRYLPVITSDVELERRSNGSVGVQYFERNDLTGKKGDYSQIRDILSETALEAIERAGKDTTELSKTRKAQGVPKLIAFLKEVENELRTRNLVKELEDIVDHRRFCQVLVRNKSGLNSRQIEIRDRY